MGTCGDMELILIKIGTFSKSNNIYLYMYQLSTRFSKVTKGLSKDDVKVCCEVNLGPSNVENILIRKK